MLKLYNEDCISGSNKIDADSVDLLICDPPFGINESSFDKHYARQKNVFDGYVEAPADYQKFSNDWIAAAGRILKPTGTLYIISGWNKLREILNAIDENNLIVHNHCIWKYNFGVFTSKKFVTSHYHILRVGKTKTIFFNPYCKFGPQEKDENNSSLLYADMEDVFYIKKEYIPGKMKNKNKLPNELINKLILYSSNENDIVCDFFLGNFTTAYAAIGLNRSIIGFELNKKAFDYHVPILEKLNPGMLLSEYPAPQIIIPKNKGEKITKDVRQAIIKEHEKNIKSMNKSESIKILGKKYQRGKFSIINILK